MFDILVPDGQCTWTSFIQFNAANADDGEVFIRSNNNGTGGSGISGNYTGNYTGSFAYGALQRVGLVFDDLGNGATTLSKCIDGTLVGTWTLSGDRWKLDVGKGALLFSDESGETSDLYVSSVLVTDKVFTVAEMTAVGVLIHYVDENNYYKLELDGEGTHDRTPGNGAGALFTLTRLRDAVEVILGQVPQRYTVGEAFDLRVQIVDQKSSAFIDRAGIFAYAIEDRAHEAGTVGLYSWGSAGVAFDDVTVIGLDGVAAPVAAPELVFLQGGGQPQGSIATPPAVDPGTLGQKLSLSTGEAGTVIENTGLWNEIKAVGFAAGHYLPALGTDFTVVNFVDVRLDLSAALDGVTVDVWAAKRDEVIGSGFGDKIGWTAHSNEARWSNLVTLDAGAGDDTVILASVGWASGAAGWLADNDDPANGGLWDGGYAGASTLFSVILGADEDVLVVNRAAGRVSVLDLGAGDELLLAGFAAGATLAHQGGGVWQVFEGGIAAGQAITLADQGVVVTTLVAGEDYLFA